MTVFGKKVVVRYEIMIQIWRFFICFNSMKFFFYIDYQLSQWTTFSLAEFLRKKKSNWKGFCKEIVSLCRVKCLLLLTGLIFNIISFVLCRTWFSKKWEWKNWWIQGKNLISPLCIEVFLNCPAFLDSVVFFFFFF